MAAKAFCYKCGGEKEGRYLKNWDGIRGSKNNALCAACFKLEPGEAARIQEKKVLDQLRIEFGHEWIWIDWLLICLFQTKIPAL